MDLNQNMMVYLQGKLRALANVITEQRIVIFMKKKKKLFSYIDLKGNFLTWDPFKLYYFDHYGTSDDPVLIEIVSLDRAVTI